MPFSRSALHRSILAAMFVGSACSVSACSSGGGVGVAASALVPTGRPGRFRDDLDVVSFQRGNVHTHSTESDGDSPPEAVYAWYRDHGYNFLGLSDHNRFTDPNHYRQLETPGFVIIPAEEITMKVGRAPVHVNAICHRKRIGGGRGFSTIGEALRWGISKTTQQGGAAMVNHPNFHWAFGAEALRDAGGAALLEVWSGHPNVNTDGDGRHLSHEAMWETALTAGWDIGAAAVDDMHRLGAGNDMSLAGPGRGWIDVFAGSANEAEICDAIRNRRLVASNGVRLARFTVRADTMWITANAPGGTVEFIGQGGALLERQRVASRGLANAYKLRGGELYVRARVTASGGARAWTQAYRVSPEVLRSP